MTYGRYTGLGRTKAKTRKKATTRASADEDEEASEKTKRGKGKKNYTYVDTIDEQVKLLRRFKNMVGKKIPVVRLLTFIKTLQRAIHERRVRKSDRYASEIDVIQRIAVQTYQRSSGQNVEVKAPAALVETLNEIGKSQKVRPSVSFLKRFVGFIGKSYNEVATRMKKAMESLEFMYERELIRETDPYYDKVRTAEKALYSAIKNRERIRVPEATLSGLNGIISREDKTDSSDELAGLDYADDDDDRDQENSVEVSTSRQMAETEFDKYAFDGFYEKLLLHPARDFWMVLYGLPFQGKTTFAVSFAKYLAENHGNVLYVSAEQYQSEGLKQIINRVQAGDLNQLHFSPSLEKAPPLSGYDFIFIDSATAANMKIQQMVDLRDENPGKAFITILQSVKTGDFRGDQQWRHLPGIVIKIHERKATVEKNQYWADGLITLPLPKLPKVETESALCGLDGHKKGSRETLVVGCGYMSSIVGIYRMLKESPESMQRQLKSAPQKVADRLVKVLEEKCAKLGARVRIEDFILTDFDTNDHVRGTAFFHCNVRGRLGELKKIIDEWGGAIFVAMQEVPWE